MEDFTFELATGDDISFLADVQRSAVRKFHIFRGTEPSPNAPTLPDEILQESYKMSHLWVIRHTGACVGFLAAVPYGGYTHIEEISIALPFQGRGLGRSFLRMFIDDSFSKGQSHITLTTDKTIPWNYPFYKTFGFDEMALEDCPDFLRDILIRDKSNAKIPDNRIAMILKGL